MNTRRVERAISRVMRRLGMRKKAWVVDGVRYKERSGTSLKRALRHPGPGVKEFDVRFPNAGSSGRRTMKIRYTNMRRYHDVGFDPRVGLYATVLSKVKPGQRVFELGCGTGSAASLLQTCVGPSGAVVSMDRDGESIRFARQRHPCPHASFELGWVDMLSGEIDGAFDVVVAVDPTPAHADSPQMARDTAELVRVLREDGLCLLVLSDPDEVDSVIDRFVGAGLTVLGEHARCTTSSWIGVLLTRESTSTLRSTPIVP